jgi:hypothetical protein
MVHASVIEARLSQLGVRVSALFRPEIKELERVLVDGEQIINIVPGRYFGGLALLTATDRRLLLIDKKALYLTVEDIRYDMISEVDYSARLLDASIVLFTVNKKHHFTALKHKTKLRELTTYVQQRVMELRYGSLEAAAPEEKAPAPSGFTQLEERLLSLEKNSYAHIHQLVSPLVSTGPAKLKQLVGAAALHDTPWSHVNPYTRTSFMTRNQY